MNLFSLPGPRKRPLDIAYILLNGTVGVTLRRWHYVEKARWTEHLPTRVRETFGLLDPRSGCLRLEIGSGLYPSPNYVHLDASRWLPHVDLLARETRIPLPDKSVDHLLAIHVLEHIHPRNVPGTLADWFRVLKPGGSLRAHVPNVEGLVESYMHAPIGAKWALGSAVFGCYVSPRHADPSDIPTRADHQAMYDVSMLCHLLLSAGFVEFADVTARVTDRHDEAWRDLTPKFSLVVTAIRPAEGNAVV